jgi:hypothetical protein
MCPTDSTGRITILPTRRKESQAFIPEFPGKTSTSASPPDAVSTYVNRLPEELNQPGPFDRRAI